MAFTAFDKKDSIAILLTLLLTVTIAILFWYHRPLGRASDVDHYARISKSVAATKLGTSQVIDSEYPPLMTTLFYVVSLLPGESYKTDWIIFFLLFFFGLLFYSYARLTRRDYFVLIATVLASAVLLKPNLVLARYDLIVAICVLLSWQAYRRDRPADSAFFLVIAAASKIIPLVLLPVLWYLLPSRQRKSALWGAASAAGISFFLPLLVLSPSLAIQNAIHVVAYHGQRGIGIESTWSGVDMLAKALTHRTSEVVIHHFAAHNNSVTPWIATMATLVYITGILVIYLLVLRRTQPGNGHHLALSFIALLAWSCAVAPVLSPQYLIWFIPITIAWLLSLPLSFGKKHQAALITLALSVALSATFTQILWPTYYQQFLAQENFLFTAILNIRNLALFVILATSIKTLFRTTPKNVPIPQAAAERTSPALS